MEKKKYFTVPEFMNAIMERVKADPQYQEAEKRCDLDYDMVSVMARDVQLDRCSFDVVGQVVFGSNEGIYGDILAMGRWTRHQEKATRLGLYTLKTLEETKEAYMAMGELVTLISYHAMEFMGENLKRFD